MHAWPIDGCCVAATWLGDGHLSVLRGNPREHARACRAPPLGSINAKGCALLKLSLYYPAARADPLACKRAMDVGAPACMHLSL